MCLLSVGEFWPVVYAERLRANLVAKVRISITDHEHEQMQPHPQKRRGLTQDQDVLCR